MWHSVFSHFYIIHYFGPQSQHDFSLVSCCCADHKSTDPEISNTWPNILPIRTKFHTTVSNVIFDLGITFTLRKKDTWLRLEYKTHSFQMCDFETKLSSVARENFSAAPSREGKKGNNTTQPLKVLCSFSQEHKTSGNPVSDKRGVKLSEWVDISMCVFFSCSAFVLWSMWTEVQSRLNQEIPWTQRYHDYTYALHIPFYSNESTYCHLMKNLECGLSACQAFLSLLYSFVVWVLEVTTALSEYN